METNIVGGDNVEGDKITAEIGNDVVGVAVGKNITQTIHYHHVKPQPVTGEILKAATVKLADLPLDQIPTVATLPAGSQMPFSHNPLFVGREEELRSLATVLKGGQTAAVGQTAAATGMGGIGKTQLAVAFVHRYGQFFRGGVFWISMADPAAIPAEIVACGAKMSELRSDYAALEFDTQLGLVLSAWQNELPRLLVFDNCEDSALFAYWRPPTGECRVLVTSRRSSWDIGLNVRVLPLDTLTRPQSLELLAKYPEQASPPVPRFTEEEGESLNQIADELGDLPLALHLAGSFLARYRHSVTLDSYLSQLRSPDLLKHPSLQFKGYNPTGHEQHVARTFSLSYEQLDRAEPIDAQALDLLVRTAHFAPGEPIPRNLLVSTMGQSPSPITLLRRVLLSGMAIIFPIKWRIAIFGKALLEETDASDIALQAEDTLQRLGDLGLVELEATGAVRLHRLIATFVINTTTEDVDTARAAVESTVLTEANRLNSTGIPGPLLAWQIHLRHVTGNAIAKKSGNTAALCNTLAALLRMIGQFTEAWPYLEQALDIRRAALGEQHPVTATSLNNIGILLRDMGEFAEARPYLEQVLDIRRATLGEQHPDTAMSLNNLGGLLRDMGQFAEARPYFEQALDIRQAALGEQHPNIAMSLNNIGMLLRDMGEFAEARPYLEQALDIRRAVLGEQHPDTATSLNNMGLLLSDMGEQAAVRPYYQQALDIRLDMLGKQHPDTALSLNNMGMLLRDMGELVEARPYLEQALDITKAVLGEQHPDTALSFNNLGTLLRDMGELVEAQHCYQQALDIRQAALGEQHPHTAQSLNNMGLLLSDMGELVEARPYLEQALGIYKAVLGEQHPDTATSLNNMGLLLSDMGELVEALPYFEQALGIYKVVLGEQHPNTVTSLNNMGLLLQDLEQFAEARIYFQQALDISKAVLGEQHSDTARSLWWVGHSHQMSNEFSEARPYYVQALNIFDSMLGSNHPTTNTIRNQLADLDAHMDKSV